MLDRAPRRTLRQRKEFKRRATRIMSRIKQRRGYRFRHTLIERARLNQLRRVGLRAYLSRMLVA